MQRIFILLVTLLLLSNCTSIMTNMMMKKMEKMSENEKKEMMIKMMSSKGDSSCAAMMEKEINVVINDSSSMADKAGVMLPICFENIFLTIEDEEKAKYLTDMVNKLIINGYPHLPIEDKADFKQTINRILEEL